MNSSNLIQRSWWRRLARRARAEAPRTNRLSHFEPLEQRTVLSAGILMPGGDDFFQTPHDAYRHDAGTGYTAVYEVAPQRDFLGNEHFGPAPRDEYAFRDPLFAPHSHDSLMPMGGMARDLPVEGQLHSLYGPAAGEGESLATLGPSAPAIVLPQLSSTSSYKVEIVIVHDDAPSAPSAAAIVYAPAAAPRMMVLTPMYISAVDNSIYASLGAAAAMQRRVDAPSYGYSSQSRLGSLNAMSEDAGSAAGKSLESTLQSTSASLLATLGTGSGISSASTHISADDEGGTNEQPLSQNVVSRTTGDETDGMIELSAADLAGQKRKLAASSESRTPVQTRLEQLTDIPVIRVSESLFRELLVLYDNSSPAASQQSAQDANGADDGLIELIAADVGSVASRHAAIPATDHSQPVTADSGIALYQTLEVAGLDDVAEVAAAVQTQATPVAPVEQVAKAE